MEKKDKRHDEAAQMTAKRARETDEEDELEDCLSPGDVAKLSRSERKRHREKKRRSDVNKGFDELMSLLLEIDPTVRAEADERACHGQLKGNIGTQEDNILSRVDLISRAVEVLRRIHQENEERKRIIASLAQSEPRLGLAAVCGSSNRDRATAASNNASMVLPTSSASNTDVLALRAAAEASHLYSRSFLDRLSASVTSSAGLLPQTPQEILGLQRALSLRGPNSFIPSLVGGGTQLSSSGIGFSGANLSDSITALFASGLARTGQQPNVMRAGLNSSALSQQYLQLLQARQNATNLAQTSNSRPYGDVGSQLFRGAERHGFNQDSRKY